MTDVIVVAAVVAVLTLAHIAFRRLSMGAAPEPDGLERGEKLIKSAAVYAEIDGLKPAGTGYAYLTDRRLVWTPRMDSWYVRNLRPGLPYTLPVLMEFRDIRRVTTPFQLGGSKLRVETRDAVLELHLEAGRFGAWRRFIAESAADLIPEGQEFPRLRRHYSRAEFMRAAAPNRRMLTVVLGIYGFYIAVRMVQSGAFGLRLSPGEAVAVLVAGLCLSVAYAAWSHRDPGHP